MTRLKAIVTIGLLIAVLVVSACQSAATPAGQKAAEQAKPAEGANSAVQAKPAEQARPAEQAKPAKPTAPDKIKIGLPVAGTHTLPVTVAAQKGFFKEENIDAEIIVFSVGTQATETLVAGETDFGLAISSAIKMTMRGADLKVISGIVTRPQLILMGKPDIKSIKDLKGRKVGAARIGDVGTYQLFEVLRQGGLNPEKDVEMVHLAGDRVPSLLQGIYDATSIVPPANVRVGAQGFTEIAKFSSVESIRDWPVTGLVTTGKLIREKPDLVLRTVRAMSKGVDFVLQQPAETQTIMAKEFNVTTDQAKIVYDSVRPIFPPKGEITAKNIQFEIDASARELEIKEKVPLEKVADFSFQNKVLGK